MTTHVVIACDHAVSTLFLMALREKLYRAVGECATHVHILTCDSDLLGGWARAKPVRAMAAHQAAR